MNVNEKHDWENAEQENANQTEIPKKNYNPVKRMRVSENRVKGCRAEEENK